MYNNEKVKEIQRVKNLSLEEMRAKRLELFTDFHNKRNTAITEVNTKRNEVLTLETDGKTEVSRLVTNTESEIIVDTKHKVDNNETGKTGITETLTNGLTNIKKVLNKYTENHTIPVANKLGNYTASELISKYNARLKLPKKSIVFDYTQGISAYDISEGRYIRPEGYESTLINKGEGIFESADGKLGGRVILNKGLFVGGKYENLFKFNRLAAVRDCTSTNIDEINNIYSFIQTTANIAYFELRYNTADDMCDYYSFRDLFITVNGERVINANFKFGSWGYIYGGDELLPNPPFNGTIAYIKSVKPTQPKAMIVRYENRDSIGTEFEVHLQDAFISPTKSHRPFIKPNYKVPDTNIKYPLYRDYKVIIMKMEKLYPEYDVINLLGDDKFILQVKKDIQSLFTREENNVFIFDKVNKNMYINGIEVSNKLFNYVELHNDLVCWYSHTSYNEHSKKWVDLANTDIYIDTSNIRGISKRHDHIELFDAGEIKVENSRYNWDNKTTSIILKVRNKYDKKNNGTAISIRSKSLGWDICRTEFRTTKGSIDFRLYDNINGATYKYMYRNPASENNEYIPYCFRLSDKIMYMNIYGKYAYSGTHGFESDKIGTFNNNRIYLSFGGSTYKAFYDIAEVRIYKRCLTDEEVQTELNKLGW